LRLLVGDEVDALDGHLELGLALAGGEGGPPHQDKDDDDRTTTTERRRQ